jgi:hypothetical protein
MSKKVVEASEKAGDLVKLPVILLSYIRLVPADADLWFLPHPY